MQGPTVTIPIEVPASALSVAAPLPELVSQRSCDAVLSIPRRAFLEALPAYEATGGRVARLGRLRLVDRAAFVAWLHRSAEVAAAKPQGGEATLAASLGLRLVGGSR